MEVAVGDVVILQRRFSQVNGWSIRPDLDGKAVEVVEVANGSITGMLEGDALCFPPDAVGRVIHGTGRACDDLPAHTKPTELEPT